MKLSELKEIMWAIQEGIEDAIEEDEDDEEYILGVYDGINTFVDVAFEIFEDIAEL